MKKTSKKYFQLKYVMMFLGITLSISSVIVSQLFETDLKNDISTLQKDLINSDQIIGETWDRVKQLEETRQNLIIAASTVNKEVPTEAMLKSILKGVYSIDDSSHKKIISLLQQKKYEDFNKEIYGSRAALFESINLTYAKRIVSEDKIRELNEKLQNIMRLAVLLQVVALVFVLSKDA